MAGGTELVSRRFDHVEEFEPHALGFLMEREAEHNLFLGICSQIKEGRYTDYYLVTVEMDGRVVAAAFRTPPHQLGLSHIAEPRALSVLATDVRAEFESLPGVLGAKEDARAFAELWQEATGRRAYVAMNQRIYQATTADTPSEVSGHIRTATLDDRDLVIDWIRAFHDEVGGILAPADEVADYRLSTDSLKVWCDPEPVSLAGCGASTPNGARVGPVFTPPELRGRGYASACVAEITRHFLDSGRRFVFLYTDLANPISNSIYQRIGYRPVCDVDQYRFE